MWLQRRSPDEAQPAIEIGIYTFQREREREQPAIVTISRPGHSASWGGGDESVLRGTETERVAEAPC